MGQISMEIMRLPGSLLSGNQHGGQPNPISYDAGAAMVREARVENIFRYAHVFPRCVAMLSSGAIDVKPLITRKFDFNDSVRAFEIAASAPKGDVKMQIELPQ